MARSEAQLATTSDCAVIGSSSETGDDNLVMVSDLSTYNCKLIDNPSYTPTNNNYALVAYCDIEQNTSSGSSSVTYYSSSFVVRLYQMDSAFETVNVQFEVVSNTVSVTYNTSKCSNILGTNVSGRLYTTASSNGIKDVTIAYSVSGNGNTEGYIYLTAYLSWNNGISGEATMSARTDDGGTNTKASSSSGNGSCSVSNHYTGSGDGEILFYIGLNVAS